MKIDLEYEIINILQRRLKIAVEDFNETLKWQPPTEDGKERRSKELIVADGQILLLETLMREFYYLFEQIKFEENKNAD